MIILAESTSRVTFQPDVLDVECVVQQCLHGSRGVKHVHLRSRLVDITLAPYFFLFKGDCVDFTILVDNVFYIRLLLKTFSIIYHLLGNVCGRELVVCKLYAFLNCLILELMGALDDCSSESRCQMASLASLVLFKCGVIIFQLLLFSLKEGLENFEAEVLAISSAVRFSSICIDRRVVIGFGEAIHHPLQELATESKSCSVSKLSVNEGSPLPTETFRIG
jgi:hypothetical protein